MSSRDSRGNEGSERVGVPRNPVPYWKRAHQDWKFGAGLFLIPAAITIYALSDRLAFLARR